MSTNGSGGLSRAPTTSDGETPKALSDLSAFQLNCLVTIADESRYGLAIGDELEAYGEREVNHGRLYPNLDHMVEMGVIEKGELDKRTNIYRVTDLGREVLADHRDHVAGVLDDDEGEGGNG